MYDVQTQWLLQTCNPVGVSIVLDPCNSSNISCGNLHVVFCPHAPLLDWPSICGLLSTLLYLLTVAVFKKLTNAVVVDIDFINIALTKPSTKSRQKSNN